MLMLFKMNLEILINLLLSLQTQATSNSATAVKSSPTRSKTLIQQAIDGVMEIYPDLEGEEIHSMLMQIKQQNNGSFKNLTVKDITERVSELKGKIFYNLFSKNWAQFFLVPTLCQFTMPKKPFNDKSQLLLCSQVKNSTTHLTLIDIQFPFQTRTNVLSVFMT